MEFKTVRKAVKGRPAVDGAGVHMTRVLGLGTVDEFDPFLMLDSFDSTDPADYVAGFPMHPHRGIETITYLAQGRIDHRDSLGNEGSIRDGQAQWMCAGSGIMHEEMPKASKRMLGVQLWLNLPAAEKMTHPAYHALDAVPEVTRGPITVRVIAGSYGTKRGFMGDHLPATFLEILLEPRSSVEFRVAPGQASYAFLLEGDAYVSGDVTSVRYDEKTALAFSDAGSMVGFCGADEGQTRVLYFSAPRLREPVAWGGPIVMNTEAELRQAFAELQAGTFIKERPEL